MADRFPLILNTSANQIQEIGSGDTLDLTGSNIKGVGIITATNLSGNIIAGAGTSNIVSGILTAVAADIDDFVDVGSNIQLGNAGVITATTFKGDGDFVELDVDGHTNLDNVSVAGVSTFAGNADFSAGIDVTGNLIASGNLTANNGTVTVSGTAPKITFTETNDNPDYKLEANGGNIAFVDTTNSATRLSISSSGINVTGNGTFSGNVSIGGTLTYEDVTNIDSVGIITAREGVFLPDLKQLKIGNTAAAPDLYLWHNSSTGNSNISNKTGDLFIQGNNGSGTVVNQIAVKSNAAVELNYQGNKKFETKSTGAAITGTLDVGAIDSTVAGGDNNFTVETTSSGDPRLKLAAAGSGGHDIEYIRSSNTLNFKQAGGSVRLSIDATGHLLPGTDSQYNIGSNSVRFANIYADTLYGAGSNITALNGSNIASGTVPVARIGTGTKNSTTFYRGDGTFQTVVTDLVNDTSPQLGGDLDCNNKVVTLNDSTGSGNNRLKIGNAGDLQLFHLSDANYVSGEVDGKDLYVRSRRDLHLVCGNNASGYRNVIYADNNGTTRMYHPASNAVRLNTTTTGVVLTGGDHSAAGTFEVNDGVDGDCFRALNGGAIKWCLGTTGTTGNATVSFDARTYGTRARLHKWTSPNRDGGSYGSYSESWYDGGTYRVITALSVGFAVDHHFVPGANNTYDLGTSSLRWRNLYTNDLNLSNEGGGNDVDGTWGDFTIQEGESDLYLINNRSGKKYKFNLTEVS